VVGSTCYRLPYRSGQLLSYNQARELCNFHEGDLAEIPTNEEYDAIFSYVKRSWFLEPSRNYGQVWLNSIYESVSLYLFTNQGCRVLAKFIRLLTPDPDFTTVITSQL